MSAATPGARATAPRREPRFAALASASPKRFLASSSACAWLPRPAGGGLPRPCGGFGGFALGLLDASLLLRALGFLFRQPALSTSRTFASARALARALRCILGQVRTPRRAAARRIDGVGTRVIGALTGAAWRRPLRRMGRFGCRSVANDAALAALFDHDLLVLAMAEALAHGARLDARLERQGLSDTQLSCRQEISYQPFSSPNLVALCVIRTVVLCKSLSAFVSEFLAVFTDRPCRHPPSGIDQVWLRDRNVLLAAHEQGSMDHI